MKNQCSARWVDAPAISHAWSTAARRSPITSRSGPTWVTFQRDRAVSYIA